MRSSLTPDPSSEGRGDHAPSPPGRRRPEGPDEGACVEAAVARLDWRSIAADLDALGAAVAPKLLSPDACRRVAAMYAENGRFRSTIVMARHGFGRGEYKYFADPLPEPVLEHRRSLWPRLAPIAAKWSVAMGLEAIYPAEHHAFRALCREAGQTRPTPLLLRYGPGDYNCLHQDIYGPLVFPLQVAILLSQPGRDFTGGSFVLTEQRPRMQSRAEVVNLMQGDGVVFAVRERPVEGARGAYRVKMRHGVSRLLSGERHTLGIIFHDAA